jgi:hypothetical protein
MDTGHRSTPTTATATLYCKVDDSSGPIAPGDLLVPSRTNFGHAMRADTDLTEPPIGEALVAFAGGRGLIPVTISV